MILFLVYLIILCLVKSIEALQILPNDRVSELFLQGNMLRISSFVREVLMQGKFYNLPVDKLADFLAKELLWQEKVYNSYKDFLYNSKIPPSQQIEAESDSIF